MARKWRIEAISRHRDSEVDQDYIEMQPGPAMRSWLSAHEKEPLYLRVTHLGSGKWAEERIELHDGWRIDTMQEGLVTLERAVIMIKADLEDAYETAEALNERG